MPELDLGNVKGPQGKSAYQSALDAGYSGSEEAFNTAMAKAPDAVLYTAQSLSDAQKAQARGNINAAPGGFGYGDTLASIDINNDEAAFNSALDALLSGLENYVAKQIRFANYPVGGQKGGTFVGTLYKHDATYAVLYGSSYDGGTIQKRKLAGAWQPWEWVNPPMELGVEYRTTERYLGKPVYAKLIPCETMPANSTYTAYIDNADEAHVINAIVSAHIYSISDSQYANESIVYIVGGRALGGGNEQSYITLKNNYAGTGIGYNVLVKYTKTTD